MKKISSLLLVAGLAVSLTACGANNNNTRTNAAGNYSGTTNTTGTNTYGTNNTYGTGAGTYGTGNNAYGNRAGTYGTGANTYGAGTYGATTRATDTDTNRRGGNWGWLGLLGLAGLAGRGRNKNPDPQR